jgi:hypothetical protein
MRSCLTPRLVSKEIKCCADEYRPWRYDCGASIVIAKAAAIGALRRLKM